MDLEALRQQRNEANRFAGLIGMEITRMEPGYGETFMPVTADSLNPYGAIHGGCLFTAADTAAGAAAAGHGITAVTLNADFHYLRPGLGCQSITARASEIKHGRRVSVYHAAVADESGRILAEGTFTYMSIEQETGL